MSNLKQGYLGEDSRYRRPIVYHTYHDHGAELFDAHMYNKGGWVLHMLRHQLGETTFRRAIKAYLERYREKEVITPDLERTLEEVTGRSLARFFQQWVYSGGYPAFEVSYSWDSDRNIARIKIKQTQNVDDLTPCFVTPVDLAFTIPTSDEAAKDAHTSQTRTIPMRITVGEDGQIEQSFYVPLEREPLMVRFDPDGWLLKTLKFERSSKMLRYQIAHDPDILGRIEAAEALGEKAGNENLEALTTALNQDAFWAVRATAASALGTIGNEKAQSVLITALQELDATQFSRVRLEVANALGKFQAPQQLAQAERSVRVLRTLLEQGDVSYRVEGAAADALGMTRTKGNIDFLTKLIDRPTWMNIVQRSIFSGLAATGEDQVVEMIASYLNNPQNHPTLRLAAARGFLTFAQNRHLYSEEARQRAVTALSHAVEHDSWERVRAIAAQALMFLGEKRVIGLLERAADAELDSFAQRPLRVAAHVLRTGGKEDEQIKQLRNDFDKLREENRTLKEQLGALEARLK